MSILLTTNQQDQQNLSINALKRRFELILQSLAQKLAVIRSNEREIIFSLFCRHPKKKEVEIQLSWSVQIDKQINIFIGLQESNFFCDSNHNIDVNELIGRMNRQIYEGVYYRDLTKPHLLKYRTQMEFTVANKYLASLLSQLYKQIEIHFISYVSRLKLLGQFADPATDNTHKSFILLGRLKEHFEVQRLKRPKATKYYDLNNCSIKTVNQAMQLINTNLPLLKQYKNNFAKMDSKRKHDYSLSYQSSLKKCHKYITENGEGACQIVRGIEVNKVVSEVKVDQSRFNIIYRGLYDINTTFTINSFIFNGQNKHISEGQKVELVKKVSISQLHQDLSFNNQIDFLKFVRMQKNKRIAQYFLALTPTNQAIGNSIYSRYYPHCLANKCAQMNERMLLRAALQIIEGINFMSQNRILHRDLKEWNILIDNNNNIRIIDFGSTSGFFGNKPNQFSCKGPLMSTPTYFYPYANVHKLVSKQFSKQEYNQCQTFDVFSFGVILSNIFCLQNLSDNILSRQLDYLSKKCREINPEDRLRPQEVMTYLFQILLLYLSVNRETIQAQRKVC